MNRKSVVSNWIVALAGVGMFWLGGVLSNYALFLQRKSIEPLNWAMFAKFIFPIFFGFLISLPIKLHNSEGKLSFDWAKFIFQGIPALILALPFTYFIFGYMYLRGINSFDLGIFNRFFHFQGREFFLNAMASVWFGKVVAECFGVEKNELHNCRG